MFEVPIRVDRFDRMKKPNLNYSQISLMPKKCIVQSRKECDTRIKFGKFEFDMPIYPSNMKSVVNEDTCEYLAENNWFYTMHRFGKEIIPMDWVIKMKDKNLPVSVSLGINTESINSIMKFQGDLTPEYITIDVANAWYDRVREMASMVKSLLPNTFLIIGNIATGEAVEEIESWGVADALKVGIAGGCFVPGTIIKTSEDKKPIEKIQPGDLVLTHKGRYKKVLATSSRKETKKTYRVNNSFSATGNHKFYVIEKKDKPLVTDENIQNFSKWVSIEEISKNKDNYLLLKNNMLNSYELVEIDSIEETPYNGDVYDFQVEDDTSYTVGEDEIIAHNSVCITKNKTGYHRPMVNTVSECASCARIPIIADGGIKEHGDIAKAIACGATMVMAGQLFAGYDRSAGDVIEIEDRKYKEYFGSASKYNKEEAKNIEGKKILIPYKGQMANLLRELKEDLQSSISYGGGKDLTVFNQSNILFLK